MVRYSIGARYEPIAIIRIRIISIGLFTAVYAIFIGFAVDFVRIVTKAGFRVEI